MGTRHVIAVKINKNYVVAQYGQWDGYPDGQGVSCLDFLEKTNLDEFKNKLKLVRFKNEEDSKELDDFLKSIGCKDGWMNMEQSSKYKQKYPLLSRDVGSDILLKLMENEKEVFVNNAIDFVKDSLMCEWAYVIDFDKNSFEVYEGFNKSPLSEGDRFYFDNYSDNGYYPVKLKEKFSLIDLPSEDYFLSCFKDEEY